MALGGMMAALAVVIMCLGGLIPIATYVCPMLCALLLSFVLKLCGKRVAWAWYGAVSALWLLLAPDREAACVFLFLGYYPIIKPDLDKRKLKWFWKGLLFNCAVLLMYCVLIYLLGIEKIASEFQGVGSFLLVVTLALGNLTFFLLDRVLERIHILK